MNPQAGRRRPAGTGEVAGKPAAPESVKAPPAGTRLRRQGDEAGSGEPAASRKAAALIASEKSSAADEKAPRKAEKMQSRQEIEDTKRVAKVRYPSCCSPWRPVGMPEGRVMRLDLMAA
jgi:hypothetical protein